MQDASYRAGVVSGVPVSVYESAHDLLALFDGDTYAAMAALLQKDNIIATLGEAVAQDYIERFDTYQREYERAGVTGAYNAGMEMGKAAVELLSLVGAPALKGALASGRVGRLASVGPSSADPVQFDREALCLKVDGVAIELSSKERDLLALLLGNAGRVMSRERILNAVWGLNEDPMTNTVDV